MPVRLLKCRAAPALLCASLTLSAASPRPARASQAGDPIPKEECVAVEGIGCVYIPSSALKKDAPTLVVYHKGLRGTDHAPVVPAAERVDSARMSFDFLNLGRTAESGGFALLVTGSSHLGIGPKDLRALEEASELALSRVILASFSGGYRGLSDSLDALERVEGIVMLDNFYFGPDLSKKIRARVDKGASCRGFRTRHAKAKYEKSFAPYVDCAIDDHGDNDHVMGATACFGAYVRGEACPMEPKRRH